MEDRSLTETPTWAVAVVVGAMVAVGSFFHASLKHFRKLLDKTKRKALIAALEKIKDEVMLFGLMSLLMGHWIGYVAKICIKSSALRTRFYPCAWKDDSKKYNLVSNNYLNSTDVREQVNTRKDSYCPEGHESFASKESLEQLHRFMFVLGIIHVSYSFVAIALAMIKIYSWRVWEHEAKSMASESIKDTPQAASYGLKLRRLSTFIFHHVSHPWSQHRVLVWLTHNLPLTYNFHSYMLRSMEEEFRDIVGISVPFWIYGILCIFLEFHGSDAYFWLSFLPAILILLIGTKLHRVVVKLAVEIMDKCPWMEFHKFNLRDDLFWFGKPKLLLWLIKLILFQNAFEMATFVWSMWEIRDSSCFMDSRVDVVIHLTFGVITQFWCSYVTFPLYVIITQMGSRFKRSIISENARGSLSQWHRRVIARRSSKHNSSVALLKETSNTSLDPSITEGSPSRVEEMLAMRQEALRRRVQ